jgi:DNA-binding MarR family transcriptional regulator
MSRETERAPSLQTGPPAGSHRSSKERLIGEVGEAFRINGNQEHAFDNLAAQRLGVNRTDLNCLDIIQRIGPLTAGELATETGLTTGAVTAVIDRLEGAGYARRLRDDEDRRRVIVEGTERFFEAAWGIWGPMKEDWEALMRKHTARELEFLLEFMRESTEVGGRHIERLRTALGGDS